MRNILRFIAAAAITLAGVTASASPTEYGFSLAGSGFSASGIFSVVGTSTPGSYLVTGITGQVDGTAIDALLAPGLYGANDNLLEPLGVPPVDIAGIAFTAAGVSFNLYADGGALGSPVGMGFCRSTQSAACLSVMNGSAVRSFALNAVPEPGAASLAMLALMACGWATRRTRAGA